VLLAHCNYIGEIVKCNCQFPMNLMADFTVKSTIADFLQLNQSLTARHRDIFTTKLELENLIGNYFKRAAQVVVLNVCETQERDASAVFLLL
jgi:hypothetical protein